MALRHVNGGYLEKSSGNLPAYPSLTVAGWFVRRADRNASSCLILLRGSGTGLYQGIYTDSTNDTLNLTGSNGSTSNIITIANDQQFFAAIVCGAPNWTLYAANDNSATLSSAAMAYFDPTINVVRVGDDGFGNFFDGESSGVMAWSRSLSAQELEAQRRYRSPIDRTGLLFWNPEIDAASAAPNAKDYSAAANDFTIVGSPTAAAGASRQWALNR